MDTETEKALIPEIEETREEKRLSTFDLKTKYKKYLQAHFQGKKHTNKNSGIEIAVSSDFVNQWVKKSRTREKIIVIQSLGVLLENSVYDGLPIPDRKCRAEIEHYKHFHYRVKINGNNYKVVLKVVKPVKKCHKMYYYSLESINA